MRFNLDTIFIADKGLIVIGIIIVIYSVICFIGIWLESVIILLMVYYNSILTIIFLSIFALGALAMNDNLIDWIDNHWDIIRSSVFSMDMNKFKNHVTTEINSLGIFSLTINATLVIKMYCISNLLGLKNLIIAISPLTNLIFSTLAIGLIIIGFYSQQHSAYTTIPTWSSTLLIILGFLLFGIGILGYQAINKLNKKLMKYHIFILIICFVLLLIACCGFFYISSTVNEDIDKNWAEINTSLQMQGFNVRKSFLVNQIEINLKFAGLFSLVFITFLIIALITTIYQHSNI